MKTVQEQETEAILNLASLHNHQREVIYKLSKQIEALEKQLLLANERIHQLESQVYGGSVK